MSGSTVSNLPGARLGARTRTRHNQIWCDRAAGPPLANCRGGAGRWRGGRRRDAGRTPACAAESVHTRGCRPPPDTALWDFTHWIRSAFGQLLMIFYEMCNAFYFFCLFACFLPLLSVVCLFTMHNVTETAMARTTIYFRSKKTTVTRT